MFCEAMLTMKNGKAKLMKPDSVKLGVVHTGWAHCQSMSCKCTCPCIAAKTPPTSMVSTTA